MRHASSFVTIFAAALLGGCHPAGGAAPTGSGGSSSASSSTVSSATAGGAGGAGAAGGSSAGSGGGAPANALSESPNAIWGSGPDDIYIAGQCCEPFAPVVARSTDGGAFFNQVVYGGMFESGPGNSTYQLFGVWGRGPGDVIAVGDGGAVGHSTDAGSTWSMYYTPGGTDLLVSVWGHGADHVYVAGTATSASSQGVILTSADGAQTFARSVQSAADALTGVWAGGDLDAYAVGAKGTAGVLLHTVDGTTWTPSGAGSAVTAAALTGVWGSGPLDVYVVGAGGTFHSTDQGTSWARVDTRKSTAVWGRGPGDVFVIAAAGSAGFDTLLRSKDGGATWQQVYQQPNAGFATLWGTSSGTSSEVLLASPGGQSGTVVAVPAP